MSPQVRIGLKEARQKLLALFNLQVDSLQCQRALEAEGSAAVTGKEVERLANFALALELLDLLSPAVLLQEHLIVLREVLHWDLEDVVGRQGV